MQGLEVMMVIFSFFLFIERIIFMFSNKLETKENMPQYSITILVE